MRKLRVREVQMFERDVRLRLPFRFGVITLVEEPQAFVRVRIEKEDGTSEWGMAADALAPKWFDKSSELSNDENYEQLRDSIRLAADSYRSELRFLLPYQLFERNYERQHERCARRRLNGLIADFGTALLDRAILDALLKSNQCSFYEGMRGNLPGLAATSLIPDLADFDFDSFLRGLHPSKSLQARHTIGLLDPLTCEDQPAGSRVGDGLPETLEEVIAHYGNRYFKVKLWGEVDRDLERLHRISEVLGRAAPSYFVTLDGNEQYPDADSVLELWAAMKSSRALEDFQRSVLFIEQPIGRGNALSQDLTRLSDMCPVVIDESDSHVNTFLSARRQGYRGITSKSCKGFYRSFMNLARCFRWNAELGRSAFLMSGEDLTTQAGVAVQQDLALVALLGLEHLERNGHHYVNGFSGVSKVEQDRFLRRHPDLYCREDQVVRLRIRSGRIEIGSLDCKGLAVGCEPDWSAMRETRLDRT